MRTFVLGLATAVLLSGAAYARPKATPATAPVPATSAQPATPAAPAMPATKATPARPATPAIPAKAAAKPRTAESLDCSKQADAKTLHGKDRKKFRNACIRQAKKG